MPARSLTSLPVPRRRGFFSRLSALLAIRGSRAQLANIDDHLLRDIGITRDQAEAEAARPFWDAPQGWRR